MAALARAGVPLEAGMDSFSGCLSSAHRERMAALEGCARAGEWREERRMAALARAGRMPLEVGMGFATAGRAQVLGRDHIILP
jgi:hypothetical protein